MIDFFVGSGAQVLPLWTILRNLSTAHIKIFWNVFSFSMFTIALYYSTSMGCKGNADRANISDILPP